MPDIDAAKQLERWVCEAQFGDYSAGASAWVGDFHRRLGHDAKPFGDGGPRVSWPEQLEAENLGASADKTRAILEEVRRAEASMLSVSRTRLVIPQLLTENLLVGSLAEDVVQGFVRGHNPPVMDKALPFEISYNGDVGLIAAVACVAAVLVMNRRSQHDGQWVPSGFDTMVDSQGLAGIASDPENILETPYYNYGEALTALHRAHVEEKGAAAVGLHGYEQNLWRRVLIVTKNQIEYVRSLSVKYDKVMVEGDLDFVSHDKFHEDAYFMLDQEEREERERRGERYRRMNLGEYVTDHRARLLEVKGPGYPAGKRFDFLFASAGWVGKVHLLEFKSTAAQKCPERPDMATYRRFLERFATRDYGESEVRHVSSIVAPSNITCTCRPIWY